MHRNGQDLKQAIIDFIEEADSLAIFVPYIKKDLLIELLQYTENCKYIVVRWEPKDLLEGASDLEIYEVCKKKGIVLFRNSRLHLKLFLDKNDAFLTTANISNRAVSTAGNSSCNYELGTRINTLKFEDRLYLQNIIDESILIDDKIIEEIKAQLSLLAIDDTADFVIENKAENKDFLISSLPMSFSPDRLIHCYYQHLISDPVDLDCLIHDLSIYNLQPGLSREELFVKLKSSFLNHPFISAFLQYLKEKRELYFGEVKDWIHKNCSNVPTPRKWEITENIQILYQWLTTFSDGRIIVDKPNHSERIRYLS